MTLRLVEREPNRHCLRMGCPLDHHHSHRPPPYEEWVDADTEDECECHPDNVARRLRLVER